jgi:alkanesulfonate monooxygenase SsuD/methylene tetrahydromethanopterin reductase-like flavin-dependent oxidoreductase (luciferase family)
MAEGWLASPSLDRVSAAQQLNQYRQACAEFDRKPRAIAIRRDIFIGDNLTEAQSFKQRMIDKGYRGFAEEAILAGTVETVAAEFAALAELGFTDIVVRNMASEQSDALATIERLAQVKQVLDL